MSTVGASTKMLAALAEFDTPTVCNVIELWDIRPRNTGYMNGSIKCCFPSLPPMVGYALTSTFRSAAPPRGSDVYTSLTDQVARFDELPGPAVVVFQDLDEPSAAATFGEVMCTTYQAFGAAGVVTSGTARDLDQIGVIGFPAYASGVSCAHGYCHIPTVGVPVTIGGITIHPGELLHGDRNGITTIPHEIASEVPDACREFIAAEDIVLSYLRGAHVTIDGMAEARKECASVLADLGRRLRGETSSAMEPSA